MKKYNYRVLLFLIPLLFLACSKDENTKKPLDSGVIEFVSFEIINNTEDLFQTETNLNLSGVKLTNVTNHGIELYYSDQLIERYDKGDLSSSTFTSEILSNMRKGLTYGVRPYIILDGKEIFGDFVFFESNLLIQIEIHEILPLNGFVWDTVLVKGKNFCNTSAGSGNLLFLGDYYQKIISNSDSLLQAVIMPDATKSTANFKVESCKVNVESDFQFVFNVPELDSISSKEYFIGEKSRVYCKNLHPRHTKVWLNEIELEVNKERDSIVDLEFFIPNNLPPGKLDFKMQVIDRVLELKQAYQSTSPEITEIDKLRTGFLDTITIKGNYLMQPNVPTIVSIGEREQTLLLESPNELKVLINKNFSTENPKLKYQSGDFTIEREIEMLPPEIISFDKEQYNLQDDVVRVKTKYFLGYYSDIKVGNENLSNNDYFGGVDDQGYMDIDLNLWLETKEYSPDFTMDKTGKIGISISTAFGNDLEYFNIVPPVINSINENEFYYGQRIIIKGTNLGYSSGVRGISDIYINDVEVPFSGNSNYSFKNQEVYLPMPDAANIGMNTLKIITGGQSSNVIEFSIIDVIPEQLSVNAGTRKDVFEIVGQNLAGGIYANGFSCIAKESSSNLRRFQVPNFILMNEPVNITMKYGPHTFDLGTLNGIEPYTLVENYTTPDNNTWYTHFDYMNEFYIVNAHGIFKLDLNSGTWDLVEPDFGNMDRNGSERRNSFMADGKIYFPFKKSFKVYDLINKQWEDEIILNISDDLDVWYATVHNNIAYIITSSSNNYKFYAYDLNAHEIMDLPQPRYFPEGIPNIFAIVNNFRQYNGRIYLELYGTIQMFDTNANSWIDLGYPANNKNRQQTNLYEYNGVLYASGGLLSGHTGYFDLYGYDFNTGQWSEKTYLPSVHSRHSVFGHNGKLYFLLGNAIYYQENKKMFSYDISLDPH